MLFCCRQRAHRDQHIFLAHDQVSGVQRSQLEAVTVGDGVSGAGLDAVAAEDAAVVVDVVDLGKALRRGDAHLVGVFRSLNINAICGTGRCAEETGYTLFQAVFVALQDVCAAVALLKHRAAQGALAVRVVLYQRRLEDFPKGDAHAFGDGGDVAHYGHEVSIRWMAGEIHDAMESLDVNARINGWNSVHGRNISRNITGTEPAAASNGRNERHDAGS